MLRKVLLLAYIARLAGSKKMEGFIVGGKPAAIQYYGHAAFVSVITSDQTFICGASIVNQNIILSAAHCFDDFNKYSKINVRAGSANRLAGMLRYAARLAVHSGYDPQTILHDIALVYLKKPFVFGPYIKRVILMKNPPERRVGYVAGWGLVDERKQVESDWLRQAEQMLWSRTECKKVLRRLPAGILCGGRRHNREYAAQGDSGSALVINGSIQIGLVSFKKPEISRSIVVYTDVGYYYDWIQRTAVRLYCP